MKNLSALLISLLACTSLKAQDRDYQFTVTAGTGVSVGLKNLKKPGYKLGLYGEKWIDEERTYWLALDLLREQPEAPVSAPAAPGSTVVKTTTYHKATTTTLTFGARKFLPGGWLFGAGVGVGMFGQIYPTHIYSDGSDYYERYEHEVGAFGLSHQLQGGYRTGKFQLLATINSIWIPYRATVDTDYERATPLYLPTFSLAAGYTF